MNFRIKGDLLSVTIFIFVIILLVIYIFGEKNYEGKESAKNPYESQMTQIMELGELDLIRFPGEQSFYCVYRIWEGDSIDLIGRSSRLTNVKLKELANMPGLVIIKKKDLPPQYVPEMSRLRKDHLEDEAGDIYPGSGLF